MNNLTRRCEAFAITILKYSRTITPDHITRPLVSQLVRSATSIGANYTEAQMAISKKDFRSKVFIAKKECAETAYWLRVLATSEHSELLHDIQNECDELIAIFQSITNKTKPTSDDRS